MAEISHDQESATIARRYVDDYDQLRSHGFSDHDIDAIKSAEHLKSRYPRESPWAQNNLAQELIWGGWSPKISLFVSVCYFVALLIFLINPSPLNLGLSPILLAAAIFNILEIEDARLAGWIGTLERLDSPIFRQTKFKGQAILDSLGVGLLIAVVLVVLGGILTFFDLLPNTIEAIILGTTGVIYLAYDVFYLGRQRSRQRTAKRIIAHVLTLDVQQAPEPVRTPRKPVVPTKMPPLTPGVKLPGSQDDENF